MSSLALIGLEDFSIWASVTYSWFLPFVKFLEVSIKVNVLIGPVLFENDDCRWDAGIKEDIGRKTDHGINGPSSSKAQNGSFSIATERTP